MVRAHGSVKSKPPPTEQLSTSTVVGAGTGRHGPIGAGACPGTSQLRITYVPAIEGSAATATQASAADVAHHARHERGTHGARIHPPSKSSIATTPSSQAPIALCQ
jgi:hypothetical protein